jgi:hypothetical protein
MFVEHFDQLCEVGEGAGETVDLVDNDNVELASSDLVQQILQGRAIQRSAGQAAVVEPVPNQYPAFVRLALDIGLTGLPLGVQRVEGQIQIVLGRLARVDRAALAFGSDSLHGPPPRSLNVACTLERRPDRPEAFRDEDG